MHLAGAGGRRCLCLSKQFLRGLAKPGEGWGERAPPSPCPDDALTANGPTPLSHGTASATSRPGISVQSQPVPSISEGFHRKRHNAGVTAALILLDLEPPHLEPDTAKCRGVTSHIGHQELGFGPATAWGLWDEEACEFGTVAF